jgi:TetR/AcrR family transcriptional regulator, transcriptional repressor of bet genes
MATPTQPDSARSEVVSEAPTSPRYRRYSSADRRAMLIDAGLECLKRGGILEFTIDNICAVSGASRGLVTHHFGSKDGLLAAVYATMYHRTLAGLEPASAGLRSVVKAMVSREMVGREGLNAWLALWGEVANNEAMRAEHRKHYAAYRTSLAAAIAEDAAAKGRQIDAAQLAVTLISLVDGLWLERCIDPDAMTEAAAETACLKLLEAFLGPVPEL